MLVYKKSYLLILSLFVAFCTRLFAQTLPKAIVTELKSPYFEKLYAHTYYSLLDRMGKDGFLPESLTGAYEGMYCRTVGALVPLLIETGRFQEAEATISCVLKATQENELERIPHVIVLKDQKYSILSDEPQIDGQAHVILAWAKLALKRGHTDFEDKTWQLIKTLTNRTCDRQNLSSGWWSTETGLVRNIALEHSRDGRRWDAWDLLTQSFVGAALKEMTAVAQRRGDATLAAYWQKRLNVLQDGIRKNLTTVRDRDTTYLEMRLPDGNGGIPYLGMGWVTLSPVAAQWEGMDHTILQNTVKAMQRTMMKTTNGLTWMPTDSYPDGRVSNEIIGKGIAWEIEFARSEKDFNRIQQLLQLIKEVNASQPIYMEGGWLQATGYKPADKLTDQDIKSLKGAAWKIKDAGNGEQTAWWCWAMARLRKEAGLPVEPKRPVN
ncbi:hypothetical protein QNI16_09040 [Cytophagaceae bacterium YF14B1]|uniref:Uncharacterized protein n=1 Tax=Xanthocytophaga flava TaxID=3048013 RepID=A0AAE3QNK4_9BACT|nr:hypothetical protein [Xanthocytophaga flavus]MDJ1480628.1 hypothetical protein [Xanthocytophaga flavus]